MIKEFEKFIEREQEEERNGNDYASYHSEDWDGWRYLFIAYQISKLKKVRK